MDKLKLHSPDLTQNNIAKIRELFPGCVTEAADESGTVRLAVDFDQLRQELSAHIVEGPQERYRLDWPGKKDATILANAPIARTLRPCEESSVNFGETRNLFIEGDNLDVLKLIQESYLGQVKVLYIDPPYNTGNDFIYSDDFVEKSTDYLKRSNQTDKAGNRLVANPKTSGRYHSAWLTNMLSRLKLSRNLLREDGVIFISIDDWELGNLRVVCEEVFGRENFVGVFCRKTKSGGGSAAGTCAVEHDYVVAYAKNTGEASALITEFGEEYLKRYKESDALGPYFWDTMERSSTATKPYKIKAPDGTTLTGKWFRSEETFKSDLKEGEVRFLQKADGWSVQFKQRLSDGKKLRTILEDADLTDKKYRSLNKELEDLIGCSLGHPPKPIELLETLVYANTPSGKDELVVDFFAGSATTGHAIYRLNAKDGRNRRFILVQLAEDIGEESEAKDKGFYTVADLARARLKAAAKEVMSSESHPDWNRDIGFRVLKVDTSNMQDVYYQPDQVDQQGLLDAVDNIKPDRTPDDLLFQVMVDWGSDLAAPISRETVQGKTVFFVSKSSYAGPDLIACFDTGVTEELVKELARHEPVKAIFRDNGFVSDAVKINVEQIFRQLSPTTEVKSL
jgi:adenine-specific DNA-methyltransferase